MDSVAEVIRYVNVALYAALAVVAVRQWRRHHSIAARWLAMTFGVIALATLARSVIPQDPSSYWLVWLDKCSIALLVLFPYFLYRFTLSFGRTSWAVRWLTGSLTLVVIGWTLALPTIPPDEARPDWFRYYIAAFLGHWMLMSLIAAWRLWRSGNSLPRVARTRMRWMATASLVLTIAILLAGFTQSQPAATLVIRLLSLASAVAFFLGFSPPAIVRLIWRRREQEQMRSAISGLMRGSSADEIREAALPSIVGVIGARAAAFISTDGTVEASYNTSPGQLDAAQHALPVEGDADHAVQLLDEQLLALRHDSSWLLMWVAPQTPIFGSEETELVRSVLGVLDTALERATLFAHVQQSHQHLQHIIDSAHDAFITMSGDGRITEWNAQAEATFGWSRAEIIGKTVADTIIPPQHRTAHHAGLKHFLATGEGPVINTRIELPALNRCGDEFPVELTITPALTSDGYVFHAFLHDISERKLTEAALEQANEELRRADQLKSDFLAMASHELRTPLTAISGFTSTIMHMGDTLPKVERDKFMEIIDQQTGRLNRLVDDLLTLSKIEAGALTMNARPVNVALAIKRTIRELGVDADIDCPDELAAIADDDHLQQILINYLGNALKYGAEPIRVTAHSTNGYVQIAVLDAGPGVPEQFVPHLFEKFQRSGLTSQQRGTGLGLSIVRGLAEAQGGEAFYEPNTPHGSCFGVRLPRALTAA